MSKRTSLFVRYFSQNLLLLLLSTILFQTCSDDNSPTEPEETPPLATATIGSGGGTLKTDDFELIVPFGAFLIDTKLTLSIIENEDSGFDNIVSREFKIEGLPQNFSQPLTIKIKYSDELTDSSYIAIGENVWVSSLASENECYHLLEGRDSSGYLVAVIPAIVDDGLLKTELNSTYKQDDQSTTSVLAISGYSSYLSEQKHFKIDFPSSVPTEAIDLASYLETAYAKFKSLGFSYNKRTNWPVEVTVKKLKSTVSGYSMNSMWGDNYGYMEFNFDKIGNTGEMKATAGHELFHMVQSLYDSRNRFSKAKFQAPNYWIDEACAVWSEGLFSSDVNYVSSVFLTSADMVYYGANGSAGGDADKYGYGMASFIKYVTDEAGNEILVKIYDEILKGNNSFVAIDNVIPDPTYLIWTEFLEKYLAYNIYKGKDFEPGSLAKEASSTGGKFVIRYDTDTIKTFSKNYKDLSAVMYSVRTVDASLSAIDENSQLNFKIDGNVIGSILLFKENNSECIFLTEGIDSVKLDNFKSITDAGYVIIAAVSNSRLITPYSKESPGTLTIKVKNKEQSDPIPIITEIYDSDFEKAFSEKRHFTTAGRYFKIKGKNFIDVKEIHANGIAFENLFGGQSGDTLITVKLPYEHTGKINIKVITAAGESNEFSYLAGIPIDYLSSSDSLTVEFLFIVEYKNSLGESKTMELQLPEYGFYQNEINWNNNVATINLDRINDISGSIKITFSDLENNSISKVVIDCDKVDRYSLHYEYSGSDFSGWAEGIYLIRDNSYLTNNIIQNKFGYSHYESNLQPNSVNGTIVYWDSPESEYRELTFSQLNLSAEGYHYNSLYFEFMHFH